jgi:hypothetical protein
MCSSEIPAANARVWYLGQMSQLAGRLSSGSGCPHQKAQTTIMATTQIILGNFTSMSYIQIMEMGRKNRH